MPVEVSVNLPLDVKASQAINPVRRQRMTIIPEGSSDGFSVPYAPREVSYSDLSAQWDVIQRTGRMPLIMRANDPQTKMAFTLTFGNPEGTSVSAELRTLTQYARMNTRLRVVYSSWEAGLWRVTSMTISSTLRDPDTNEITRATVDIEFTLASDITTNIGPVSGGVYTPPGSGLTPIGGAGGGGGVRKYTVKKGDTLHKIAIKFYRNSSKWKTIAKANKIKNPRSDKKLKVGRVLRIP